MSCVLVVCVLLLVSQVEMVPVNTAQLSSSTQVDLASPVSLVDLVSVDQASGLLTRMKRAALANAGQNKCSNGMTELWDDGPCVTCEKYMELQDTDECPGY